MEADLAKEDMEGRSSLRGASSFIASHALNTRTETDIMLYTLAVMLYPFF